MLPLKTVLLHLALSSPLECLLLSSLVRIDTSMVRQVCAYLVGAKLKAGCFSLMSGGR